MYRLVRSMQPRALGGSRKRIEGNRPNVGRVLGWSRQHGGIMSAHLCRLRSSKIVGVGAVFALLAALLYATVLAAPAGARRQWQPSRRALAQRLLKRDPGRRLGGDTIVGVSNEDLLLGVANRINFMIALGSGETIVGGNRNDQLGALGKNATIHSRAGNDAIHGGPGHDVISGGAGNDLITDTKGSATINTGSGKNEVEVAGHPGRDRVLCASGSVDRIYANRGDSIAPSCRKASGSLVAYHEPRPTKPPTAQHNECSSNNQNCTFLAASGSVPFLWTTDTFPERRCPPSHPYLLEKDYFTPILFKAPGMQPVGNIDYFMTVRFGPGNSPPKNPQPAIGNGVGEVTNWTLQRQEWQMWFHCTSQIHLSYCGSVGGRC
jgi:RTX calcium-binding nonapeptide repeat (4 copies)